MTLKNTTGIRHIAIGLQCGLECQNSVCAGPIVFKDELWESDHREL